MADTATTSSVSGRSSHLTHVGTEQPPLENASDREKVAPPHSVELEAQALSQGPIYEERSRWIRLQKTLRLDHPRVLRVWYYFRGPRPKVDLPGEFVFCETS